MAGIGWSKHPQAGGAFQTPSFGSLGGQVRRCGAVSVSGAQPVEDAEFALDSAGHSTSDAG